MSALQVSTRQVALLALLLSVVPAMAAKEDKQSTNVGTNPLEMEFAPGGRLDLDLCSSGVEVRGTDENKVRISYDAKSGDEADRVKASLKSAGSSARVEINNCPHNNFQITISVPKITHLHVRMWAGQLDVSGITGDKDLELHAGQLNVKIGQVADYARVDASVMTGEVDASPFDVSKGGLFRSFERKGPGKYRLHAHVGAGEVDLN